MSTKAKSLSKINKLINTEYYLGILPKGLGKKYFSQWMDYRSLIQHKIKEVNKELIRHEAAQKHKYINQRVEKIRESRNSNTPGKFFKKAPKQCPT